MNTPGQLLRTALPAVAALLLISVGSLVAIKWGIATDRADARDRLVSTNLQIVDRLELIVDEFEAVGRDIAASDLPPCSGESLEHYRRVLFELEYLRDIGFVSQRTLMCSTAIGVVENPVVSSMPDFVLPGGLQIYVFRPVRISAGQSTMILQADNYNALVDPSLISGFSAAASIESLALAAGPGARRFPMHREREQTRSAISTIECSERYGFCVEATAAVAGTHWASSRQIGMGVLGAGSGLAVFLLVQSMLLRSRNPVFRLRRAIRRREMHAVYQPIFSMPDGKLVGVELLARWPDAPDHLKKAEKFISEAETNGLIRELTEMMMEIAASEVADWLIADPSRTLAINISASELSGDALPDRLLQRFVDRGIRPGQIVLELTERSIATPRRIQLDRLAEAGFQIYIDDLGEGYSSLSYLHHLPISGVKISRSFTSGLGTDSPKVDLVLAMIEVARKRKLAVVLEGIETRDQHQAMMELGPLHCQGFHYARPMTAQDLIQLSASS